MSIIIAKLTAAPGKEDQMRAELEKMVATVDKEEPGVVQYSLHTVDGEPGTFWFYEEYANDDAQQAHGQTEHMKALGTVMRDLAAGRPEIARVTKIAGVNR